MAKKKGILSALFGGAGSKKSGRSRASKARSKPSSSKGKSAASKSKSKTKTAPKSSAPKSKVQTKKPPMKATKNKNVSQRYPNGRTLQTRDEYFYGAEDYKKPGYEEKGLYRKAVIVDSNRNHDLAIVKLTTSKKGKSIPGQEKSKYRPFVETLDEKGAPIKIGKKFKENPPQKDLSPQAVAKIKKDVFKDSNNALKNREKVRKMKGRM